MPVFLQNEWASISTIFASLLNRSQFLKERILTLISVTMKWNHKHISACKQCLKIWRIIHSGTQNYATNFYSRKSQSLHYFLVIFVPFLHRKPCNKCGIENYFSVLWIINFYTRTESGSCYNCKRSNVYIEVALYLSQNILNRYRWNHTSARQEKYLASYYENPLDIIIFHLIGFLSLCQLNPCTIVPFMSLTEHLAFAFIMLLLLTFSSILIFCLFS